MSQPFSLPTDALGKPSAALVCSEPALMCCTPQRSNAQINEGPPETSDTAEMQTPHIYSLNIAGARHAPDAIQKGMLLGVSALLCTRYCTCVSYWGDALAYRHCIVHALRALPAWRLCLPALTPRQCLLRTRAM